VQLFETFNFDIIIILVLFVSVVTGMYYSFYKQIGKFLMLYLPFLILYFIFDIILNFYLGITNGGILKESTSQKIINVFIIYILSFIMIALIIKFVHLLFKPTVTARVLNDVSKTSRVAGALLGVMNAYLIIFLLMYLVNPLIDINYNNLLTKTINNSSNEVLTITKLNIVQNVNVEEHKDYQEAEEIFTGRAKLNALNKLTYELTKIDYISNDLKTLMYPTLSNASKELIDAVIIDNDYLSAVLKADESGIVFEKILVLEVANPDINNYQNYYNQLKNNDYLIIYQEYLNRESTSSNIEEVILLNKYEIINKFKNQKYEIIEIIENINIYNDYESILSIPEVTYSTLSNRVTFNENLLRSIDSLETLKEHLDSINSSEKEFSKVKTLKLLVDEALKNTDNVFKMNPNMCLSTRVILARNYKFYNEFEWTNNLLLNSYLINSLVSTKLAGYDLYHEYFFYRFLAFDLGTGEVISHDYYNLILERLEAVVVDGLINSKEASTFINLLLENKDSSFNDLVNRGQVGQITTVIPNT
jgi:hypothetical protein